MPDINPEITKTVKEIVFNHLDSKDFQVFIYGSRARGTSQKFSDVDIGIQGKTFVPTNAMTFIINEFEESDFPYRVDVVDFSRSINPFKQIAQQDTVYLN